MNIAMLKEMMPGLVSYAAENRFEVNETPAYLGLTDLETGTEYLVEYIGRNMSKGETDQIKISDSAAQKLIERCKKPGNYQSEKSPALGYIWIPENKHNIGFCVLDLAHFTENYQIVGRGKPLSRASGHYYLNTRYLEQFIYGEFPCLVAGEVTVSSITA